MNNIIKYYYGLDVSDVIEKNGNYHLIINNNNFLLCECNKNELLEIVNYITNNYVFHHIVLTNNKNLTILLKGKDYVLLKLKTPYNKIQLEDVLNFNYPINIAYNNKIKWINLWSEHIDYIEYQIHELLYKYPAISKYIYYYIGLAENAIELLKTINNINHYEYIEHKRISIDMTLVDLYNPITLVIDSRVRDISEYYKSLFFIEDIATDDLISDILNFIKELNDTEIKLFFARMMYPTYFFDAYDQIIGFSKDEDIIYNIVEKSDKYEMILKELYKAIKKATHIENIEWLIQLH